MFSLCLVTVMYFIFSLFSTNWFHLRLQVRHIVLHIHPVFRYWLRVFCAKQSISQLWMVFQLTSVHETWLLRGVFIYELSFTAAPYIPTRSKFIRLYRFNILSHTNIHRSDDISRYQSQVIRCFLVMGVYASPLLSLPN